MRLHPTSDPWAASAARASYNSRRFVNFERQNAELEIGEKELERANRALNVRDQWKSRLSSQRPSLAPVNDVFASPDEIPRN